MCELQKDKFFKKLSPYKRGTVHMMNFDREYSWKGEYFQSKHMIGKFRYGLIISDTSTNQYSCTVIPIKTDREVNQMPFETYLPICVEDGKPGLLVISQITSLPIDVIQARNFGEVREDFLNEVFRYVDIHF